MNERRHQKLTRIFKQHRRATRPEIAVNFNAAASRSVTVRMVQRIVNFNDEEMCRKGAEGTLLIALDKVLRIAWARKPRHGLLITGNTLSGLMSLVSTGRMDVCGNGDNLMNPRSLHVNRGMFKLVVVMSWFAAYAFGVLLDP